MTDFEEQLSDAFAAAANDAPGAQGLEAAARDRARRHRRRTSATLFGGAAVVLAIGSVTALAYRLGDAGNTTMPDVSHTTEVPGELWEIPKGWRAESYGDLEFAVPPTWKYGTIDQWCASAPEPDPGPMVDRPGVQHDVFCMAGGYGALLWRSDNPRGDSNHAYAEDAGIAEATIGETTLRVIAPTRKLADQVAATARPIGKVDSNGCPATVKITELGDFTSDFAGDATPGGDEQLSVCRYARSQDGSAYPVPAYLAQSERLSAKDSASLFTALEEAPPGSDPDSHTMDCASRVGDQAVLLRTISKSLAWVHYDGCAGNGIDLGESTRVLTPEVLRWSLSPGWSGGIIPPGSTIEISRSWAGSAGSAEHQAEPRCCSLRSSQHRRERIQDRGVLDRRGHHRSLAVGNLAHRLAQDLARSGLGQGADDIDATQRRHRSDLVAHLGHQLLPDQLRVGVDPCFEHHEPTRQLAFELIGDPDDSTFSNRRVTGQHRLHCAGGEPVASHVDHVVGAPHHIQVAVLVEVATVTGQVVTVVSGQIRGDVAIVIAPQGRQGSRWQRQLDRDRPPSPPPVECHRYPARAHRSRAREPRENPGESAVLPGHAGWRRSAIRFRSATSCRPRGCRVAPQPRHRCRDQGAPGQEQVP